MFEFVRGVKCRLAGQVQPKQIYLELLESLDVRSCFESCDHVLSKFIYTYRYHRVTKVEEPVHPKDVNAEVSLPRYLANPGVDAKVKDAQESIRQVLF